MAFLLGSFTNGMFSGAKDVMSMANAYGDYNDKQDMRDAAKAARSAHDQDAASAAGNNFANGYGTSGGPMPGDGAPAPSTPDQAAPASSGTGRVAPLAPLRGDLASVVQPRSATAARPGDAASALPVLPAPAANDTPDAGGVGSRAYAPGSLYDIYNRAPSAGVPKGSVFDPGTGQVLPAQSPSPHYGSGVVGGAKGAIPTTPTSAQPHTFGSGSHTFGSNAQAIQAQRVQPPQPAPPMAGAPQTSTPTLASQQQGLGAQLLQSLNVGP